MPKPDDAMNNIVNPRNASSETRRSGVPGGDEGLALMGVEAGWGMNDEGWRIKLRGRGRGRGSPSQLAESPGSCA